MAQLAQKQIEAAFAQARRWISNRVVLDDAIGNVVTLVIQSNDGGNLLTRATGQTVRLYNVGATTVAMINDAKAKGLKSLRLFQEKLDEAGVEDDEQLTAFVNDILNKAQVSFSQPITAPSFKRNDIVRGLVAEYHVDERVDEGTGDVRPAHTGIGLNNVTLAPAAKTKTARDHFSDEDDDEVIGVEAAIETAPADADPFADSNVPADGAKAGKTTKAEA